MSEDTLEKVVDTAKLEDILERIQWILNDSHLNVPELIVLYGNLGYHIGCAMAGIDVSPGPSLELVEQVYHEKPTVDTALMLQGMTTTTWAEDYVNHPELSRLRQVNKGEERK